MWKGKLVTETVHVHKWVMERSNVVERLTPLKWSWAGHVAMAVLTYERRVYKYVDKRHSTDGRVDMEKRSSKQI